MKRGFIYFCIVGALLANLWLGVRPAFSDVPWRLGHLCHLLAAALLSYVWINSARENRRADEKKVLDLLKREPGLWGAKVSEKTGLSISTAMVTLFRLEQEGRIVSEWQDGPTPRKRLYSIA